MATISAFEGVIEFVALAEAGSFTAAAKRLGVSTSHISRQVAALEERLAVKLVSRTTRQSSLTELGQAYYTHALGLIDSLETANNEVAGEGTNMAGPVRISLAGHFCHFHVAPVLIHFARKHPEIRPELDFSSAFVNFVDESFDFAIRFGAMPTGNVIARKLANQYRVAVASPEYLENHGTPAGPDDLSNHDCIVAVSDSWTFNVEGEQKRFKVSGRIKSNSQPAILEAVRAGLGIAYMPARSFGPELHDGTFTEILADYSNVEVNSWIVYPDRRHLTARARVLVEHLLEHFRDWR
jgi:DNA-binding transcriptional LysR family regulator